ncbi:helix-turn-helix domain-containing protein [Hydromonas duriensis]|uniref:Cytoskeleton protein RodZ n=1 Tax=Hydromonas duriensis TaxID=1527608 RepID=A0A4R6Y823_9BURK|nr:helix-turn-helix domain-containing protein [Hydromonas duriensis]TDR31503.1 cytoskeleton protein RodZ [Hydromonas duriensis]
MTEQDKLNLDSVVQEDGQKASPEVALTLGQWLVNARQAKGLNAQDVASRSNRALRQIEALEADDLSLFGSANLLRAVVRHYAKIVGVDPDEAVSYLPAQYQNQAAVLPERESRVSEKVASQGTPLNKPWIGKIWLVLLSLVVASLLAYWVLGTRLMKKQEGVQKVSEPNQVQVITQSQTVAPAPVVEPTAAPATAPVENEAASAPSLPNDALMLKFKVASWVEIKDAKGTVLLSGTQEAGTEQTVTGELPLKVKIGNASQVEATWKGQPYDLKAAIANKGKDVAKIDELN